MTISTARDQIDAYAPPWSISSAKNSVAQTGGSVELIRRPIKARIDPKNNPHTTATIVCTTSPDPSRVDWRGLSVDCFCA